MFYHDAMRSRSGGIICIGGLKGGLGGTEAVVGMSKCSVILTRVLFLDLSLPVEEMNPACDQVDKNLCPNEPSSATLIFMYYDLIGLLRSPHSPQITKPARAHSAIQCPSKRISCFYHLCCLAIRVAQGSQRTSLTLI